MAIIDTTSSLDAVVQRIRLGGPGGQFKKKLWLCANPRSTSDKMMIKCSKVL